jgi:hypothetical protein
MTPHAAATALAALRAPRVAARFRRYRPSRLRRFRAELVALRRAGASYRELAQWLRQAHRRRCDPTTIRRFLVQLPELQEAAPDAELS